MTGYPIQIGHPIHRLEREFQEIRDLQTKMANDNRFVWNDPMTLFFRYAVMKQRNMPPVNHKLHPEKHFTWDFEHGWPLALGTSLNDRQYVAIEAILAEPQVARTCYCGNNMVYGDNKFGYFCSEKCQTKHIQMT